MSRRWILAALVVIILLAFILRVENLSHYPPGLTRDEAVNALDAFKVADGVGFSFYEDANRPEPLYRLIQGGAVLLFGHSVWALRLVSALVGTLTVAAAYWAVAEALVHQGSVVRRLAGIAGAVALTVCLSHTTLTRTLYRAVPQPLFTLMAVALLLRGIRTQRRLLYVAAGVCLALPVYTYTAGLIIPGLVVPLGLWLLLFRWLPAWRRKEHAWYRTPDFTGFLLLLLALLMALAPIGLLLIKSPNAVLGRAGEVSAGGNEQTHPPATLLERFQRTWQMWAVAGDGNPQYNVASAPLLPPGTYPLFLLGLAMCLLWLRQPASWLIPPLVLFGLVPVALSNEVRHGLRIMGAFAPLPLAIGYGVGGGLAGIRRLAMFRPSLAGSAATKRGLTASLIALVLGAASAGSLAARASYANYWLRAEPTWKVYDQQLTAGEWFFLSGMRDFASWVNVQEEPVYIPASSASHPTLRAFLTEKHPQTVAAPGTCLPAGIIAAPLHVETQDWARWDHQFVLVHGDILTVLPPFDADSHRMLVESMDKGERLVLPDGALGGYSAPLPNPASLGFETVRDPLTSEAVFDGAVTLAGWSTADDAGGIPHLTPSSPMPITLYWQKVPTERVKHEYLSFVQLWTQTDSGVSGVDTELLRWLYPPTAWREGEAVAQVVALDVPPDIVPGAYQLVTGIYAPFGTAAPVTTRGHDPLGTIARVGWLKVPQAAPPDLTNAARRLEIAFGADIILRGATQTAESNRVRLELYWEAVHTPQIDATIFVHAVNTSGAIVAQQDNRPWDGQYPTFIWDAGELVVTEHILEIPSSEGPVTLYVGAYTWPGPVNLGAVQAGRTLPDGRAVVGDTLP